MEAVHPSPSPGLQVPASSSTVDVRVINTNTRLYLKPGVFWEPALPGFEGPHSPIYCFLVSHGDRHIVFDLGVRIDWENLPPKIVKLVKATTTVSSCDRDVVSVLDEDTSGLGIRSSDIEAVIWSHNHFDHTGDPSRFPPSTELVVGPGVKGSSWPGYPSNPDGAVLDSDAAGRNVREISFEDMGLKIGRFDAFDYFGDGSFYLLDAPGHAPGHICGLARTTANPPSFVFMGADACHHAGVLRPSQYLPLPQPTPPSHIHSHGGCPGDLLMHLASWKSPDEPFFQVARGPLFPDHDAAMTTVSKIQELDAASSVLVLLAHDDSLGEHLPLFPARVNDWQAQNIREDTRWAFCKELENVRP
ncbi:Metallo-hydrolase/oxidoreductase [Penicillium hispanicum]|uniref:Metallo-hydrolase/oxidoreductase n=1 Tax=Penicillium hispanicum TaxID=1080232 RepID=UPI00253F916B|nr:Metallo-hydrolase/oxidoreductase [Penicillium hispanicum]KAJ5578598.1 Metallo-hydrolase/oxidoreductase [Penicillium hispanicum]